MTGFNPRAGLFNNTMVAAVDGKLVLLVHNIGASTRQAPAQRLVGVSAYTLDEAAVAALQARMELPGLRAVAGPGAVPADHAGIVLESLNGVVEGALVWPLPAARLTLRFQALSTAGLLLLAAVGAIYIARRRRAEMTTLVSEVEAHVYDVAMRDPLTGLLNRASFKRKLESLVSTHNGKDLIGVVYIDLDRFKQVNDGYGHLKGDELLCAVTERLCDLTDDGLSVARLGGDEFALIVERRTSPEAIMAIAERACECLGFPFQLGEVEASIGGSVGVSICPLDGDEPIELLRRADIAMYRAKSGGRNMTIRFDNTMDSDVQERRALELDLRRALDRNELTMAYQPYWASDGQTLIGVEALVRWTHPTRGPVSPAQFVPIAEEAGMIHELGEWTIRRSLEQAKGWNGIALAVNISPLQFKRPGLAMRVKDLMAEIGFEPERLEVEITEGVLITDADAAIKFIRSFREMGVHVALDDFGTGYSSLSYLRRFPFDKLKVDQSFVRALGTGPGTAAIIHSVIALGRALGLTVHAEGVETLEHHIFLRAAGCHHLQGYLFARPMPAEAIEELLKTKTIRPAIKPIFADTREVDPLPNQGVGSLLPSDGVAGPDGLPDTSVDLGALLREKVAAMKMALGTQGSPPTSAPLAIAPNPSHETRASA